MVHIKRINEEKNYTGNTIVYANLYIKTEEIKISFDDYCKFYFNINLCVDAMEHNIIKVPIKVEGNYVFKLKEKTYGCDVKFYDYSKEDIAYYNTKENLKCIIRYFKIEKIVDAIIYGLKNDDNFITSFSGEYGKSDNRYTWVMNEWLDMLSDELRKNLTNYR